MKNETILNRSVVISDRKNPLFNISGIVTKVDGEDFYIQIAGIKSLTVLFTRDEFTVRRNTTGDE